LFVLLTYWCIIHHYCLNFFFITHTYNNCFNKTSLEICFRAY
jgi:hypothetical protein